MSRGLRANRGEVRLLPHAIDEWIGMDHPARFVDAFLDRQDLKEIGFTMGVAGVGRDGYAADLLLKILVLGYFYGITSFRKLERACHDHMGFIWLGGKYQPDHTVLWRFWDLNQLPIQRLFVACMRAAHAAGAIDMALHAVDGTKMRARGSKRTMLHEQDLQEYRKKIEARAAKVSAKLRENTPIEDEGNVTLPSELQSREELAQRIADAEQRIAEIDQPGPSVEAGDEEGQGASDEERKRVEKRLEEIDGKLEQLRQTRRAHLQPSEPEAQLMVSNGRTVLGYNAQIVADGKSGLIAAQALIDEANDTQQLVPMLDEVRRIYGSTAQTTLADSGYETAVAIGTAEDRGYEVLVASKQQKSTKPYHASKFIYDAERDVVRCPEGRELERVGVRNHADKPTPLHIYRTTACRSCPVLSLCTKDQKGRTIELSPHKLAIERHRAKRALSENRALMRNRSAIVERPFAVIKEIRRWTRFTVFGKARASTQWTLICLGYNLRVLFGRALVA